MGLVSPRPHLLLLLREVGRERGAGGTSWCPPLCEASRWVRVTSLALFPRGSGWSQSGVGETRLSQCAGEAEGVFSWWWDQAW